MLNTFLRTHEQERMTNFSSFLSITSNGWSPFFHFVKVFLRLNMKHKEYSIVVSSRLRAISSNYALSHHFHLSTRRLPKVSAFDQLYVTHAEEVIKCPLLESNPKNELFQTLCYQISQKRKLTCFLIRRSALIFQFMQFEIVRAQKSSILLKDNSKAKKVMLTVFHEETTALWRSCTRLKLLQKSDSVSIVPWTQKFQLINKNPSNAFN